MQRLSLHCVYYLYIYEMSIKKHRDSKKIEAHKAIPLALYIEIFSLSDLSVVLGCMIRNKLK